jgi:hypothetical protein
MDRHQALVTSFWVRPMDGMVLKLFILATFIGGVTSGLAGFAMGLVMSGIWLLITTPIQTATLIVGYGLLTQSYANLEVEGGAELAECGAINHRRRGPRTDRNDAAHLYQSSAPESVCCWCFI